VDHLVWEMGTLEDECETALKFLQNSLDESRERAPDRRLRVPEVLGKNGGGFGIRLRLKAVTSPLKDLAEITRVSDNSVMDDAEFGSTHNTL
jgi:hypothetical protein